MAAAAKKSASSNVRKIAVKRPADRAKSTSTQRTNGAPVLSIKAKVRERFPVNLVGTTYKITAPKSAISLSLAQIAQSATEDETEEASTERINATLDTMYSWVDAAFTATDAAAIKDRLYDPADDLDIDNVMELISAVSEYISANPPT